MCNPGAKENGDMRFNSSWTGTLSMFRAYRAQGVRRSVFAPDPNTSHDCGDSRVPGHPLLRRLPRCAPARTAILPAQS